MFDRLGTNHGIGATCDLVKNLYEDAIGEIRCLDLQFRYKGTYHSLDGTDAIDFKICKNPPFDLVLGQSWLWMHEAKIIFEFSPRIYEHHDKIVIDGMSIPLIGENSRLFRDDTLSHKASSTKNNLSKSTESKPGLTSEKITNTIKKISQVPKILNTKRAITE